MSSKFLSLALAGALALATVSQSLAGGLYTNGLPPATSFTGNETIPADTNLPSGLNPQTEAITLSQLRTALGSNTTVSTNTAVTSATLTTAQVTGNGRGGLAVISMTGTLTAAATATTPTAAAWIAAIPNLPVGGTYTLRIINNSSGAFAWTLAGGTGVTVSGTATIAQNTYRDFLVTVNATTVTAVSIGSGTN